SATPTSPNWAGGCAPRRTSWPGAGVRSTPPWPNSSPERRPPVLVQRPVRVVRDLPGVPVRVGEVPRIPAPEHPFRRTGDPAPGRLGGREPGVDLLDAADVDGQRRPDPGAFRGTGVRVAGVLGERVRGVQREDGAAGVEHAEV